jgi:hypothetical protein
MKRTILVVVALLLVWTAASYYLYPEKVPVKENSIGDAASLPARSVSAESLAISAIAAATSTTPDPVVATSTKKATVLPSVITYKDPVAGFSIAIPKGWTSKVEDASSSPSLRFISFAPLSEIDKDSPEPLLTVSVADLNRQNVSDSDSNKEVKDIITNLGPDSFVNFTIDEVFKKQWNAFELKSVSKKTIDGKVFFVIDARYISEKTDRNTVFVAYMNVTPDKVITLSAYSFTENWPAFKDSLLRSISSFTL